MQSIDIFDSRYGNTEKIARAIGLAPDFEQVL